MVNLSSIIFISPFTSPRQINAVDAPLVASQAAGFSCKAEGFSADSFQLFGLRLEFWFASPVLQQSPTQAHLVIVSLSVFTNIDWKNKQGYSSCPDICPGCSACLRALGDGWLSPGCWAACCDISFLLHLLKIHKSVRIEFSCTASRDWL